MSSPMMKIDKSSWHFRLYKAAKNYCREQVPDRVSLCSYFWRTAVYEVEFFEKVKDVSPRPVEPPKPPKVEE